MMVTHQERFANSHQKATNHKCVPTVSSVFIIMVIVIIFMILIMIIIMIMIVIIMIVIDLVGRQLQTS